jgi:hypothetical protein
MDHEDVLIDRLERRLQERERMRSLESKVRAQEQGIADLHRTTNELRHALDALVAGVLRGICPVTAHQPQVVNSLAGLRNVSGVVNVGQLFDVLVGGSNARELHEVTAVNASGQILSTKVLEGPTAFAVPQMHTVRSD